MKVLRRVFMKVGEATTRLSEMATGIFGKSGTGRTGYFSQWPNLSHSR
jgi:hypothetical protein